MSGSRGQSRPRYAPYVLTASLLLAVLASGVALLATGRRNAFLGLLATVMLLQNIVVMVLLRTGLVSADEGQYLLLAKESLVLLALGGLAVLAGLKALERGSARFPALPIAIFGWFAFLMLHALAFGSPWLARLAGLRSLAMLPALFLLGYFISLGRERTRRLVRLIVVIGVVLAAFGLLEAYVLPANFWLDIGHEEYYEMKIGRAIQGSLYGNMRAWIAGEPVRRVASLTGDPLISSYPMALVLVLLMARYVQRQRFKPAHLLVFIPVGLATLLTLSRGAALSVLLAAGLLAVASRRPKLHLTLAVAGLLAVTAGTALFGEQILQFTSGRGHIEELVEGLRRGVERPFGFGLGSASSVATGVARSNVIEGVVLGGGDSFLGSVATQTGIVGAVWFYGLLLWMVAVVAEGSVDAFRRGDPHGWWYAGSAAMLSALIVTSAVNESGFGFVASGLTYLLAGSLVAARRQTLAHSPARVAAPRAADALAAPGDASL